MNSPVTYGKGANRARAAANPLNPLRYVCLQCHRDFGDIESLDAHAIRIHQAPLTMTQMVRLAGKAASFRKEVEARARAIRAGAPPAPDLTSWSPWKRQRARGVDSTAREWIRLEDEQARKVRETEATERAADEARALACEWERAQAAREREITEREAERARIEWEQGAPARGLSALFDRAETTRAAEVKPPSTEPPTGARTADQSDGTSANFTDPDRAAVALEAGEARRESPHEAWDREPQVRRESVSRFAAVQAQEAAAPTKRGRPRRYEIDREAVLRLSATGHAPAAIVRILHLPLPAKRRIREIIREARGDAP